LKIFSELLLIFGQPIYITLPDACGIGIFHGDLDSVDSDICGDG